MDIPVNFLALLRFMQVLVPAGCTIRLIYCLAMGQSDAEEASSYKKRGRNALVFTVIATSISALIAMMQWYYA